MITVTTVGVACREPQSMYFSGHSSFWPTVLSVEPLVHCVVCLLRHVSQRVGLIVAPGCLSVCMYVCMSVGHSSTYSLPRLIDHNQIWYAGTYLSSQVCKPFWIPCLPYSRFQMEKYGKFRLFPTLNRCHLDIRTQIKKADVSRCVCPWRVLCQNISKLDHEMKDE